MDKDRQNTLVFNVFDGKNFREWKETMMLFLMGLGLWIFFLGFKKPDSEITDFEQKKQKAFAIVSLNLSSSCRDCLCNIEDHDPAVAWETLLRKYERKTPPDKLMALEELLDFILDQNDIPGSISRFKQIIQHIKLLEISLDEHLFIALLLRKLPSKFAPLATNLRHREEIDFDTPIIAVENEARAINDPDKDQASFDQADTVTSRASTCPHCPGKKHTEQECWKLHPELRPTCDSCGGRHYTSSCKRRNDQHFTNVVEGAFVL